MKCILETAGALVVIVAALGYTARKNHAQKNYKAYDRSLILLVLFMYGLRVLSIMGLLLGILSVYLGIDNIRTAPSLYDSGTSEVEFGIVLILIWLAVKYTAKILSNVIPGFREAWNAAMKQIAQEDKESEWFEEEKAPQKSGKKLKPRKRSRRERKQERDEQFWEELEREEEEELMYFDDDEWL